MARSLRRAGDKLRLLRGPEQGRAPTRAAREHWVRKPLLRGTPCAGARRHGAFRRGIENDDRWRETGVDGETVAVVAADSSRGTCEKRTRVYSHEVQITEDRDRRRDRRLTSRASFLRASSLPRPAFSFILSPSKVED